MPKKSLSKKIRTVQKLVKDDLSNGRCIQKKIRSRLQEQGISPETIIEELESIKTGR